MKRSSPERRVKHRLTPTILDEPRIISLAEHRNRVAVAAWQRRAAELERAAAAAENLRICASRRAPMRRPTETSSARALLIACLVCGLTLGALAIMLLGDAA